MPRGENRASILLSRDENEQVFGLIGPKCQSLATAVVQLFTTEGPAHSEWKKKDTGVLCLIKDNSRRSYFFRIYCLYRKAMIWEHEVYMQIEYKNPRPYLHTFEAEEYMTAFNFANEDEAKILRNILIEKIELRKQRREERRQRSLLAARANSGSSQSSARQNGGPAPPPPAPPAPAPAPVLMPAPLAKTAPPPSAGNYTARNTVKRPKARKLTKADIGSPQDFKHISHVGWDADKGFDVENLPEEEMRYFFSKAGISEKQLQDQDTRQFIYDFINTHGGIDAVKEDLNDIESKIKGPGAPPAPPVPARSPAPHAPPPPCPPHPPPPAPPAPPSRAPPPPPARAVPPPPPPPAAPRHPPPPRPAQPPSSAPPSVPPPPPPPDVPAPPPPPPPPAAPAAPPPPPPPPLDSAPPAADPRAALMESIRSGSKGLKKVEVAPKTPVVEDSRSNLLSEIRQGIELRSVTRSSSNAGSERKPPACGLAGALARALQERSRAIHSSDSELSDETTSDGEWED